MSSASLLRSELLALGELPEPEPVAAPVTYRPKSESFADDEQSLFSLVLASQDEEATAFASPLSDLLPGAAGTAPPSLTPAP